MKKRIIKNGFVSKEAALKINNCKDLPASDEIKKNDPTPEKPIPKINKEEEAIIDHAKKEAEEIINAGKKEADRIYEEQKKQGYDKGYEEGKKRGYEEINKEKDSILNEVISIKEDAQKKYRGLLESSEKDILDMVFNISNKLIYEKLNKDKSVVFNIVKETIEKTAHKKTINLYVSSADFNTVTNKRGRLLAKIDGIETLEIFHDPSLTIGSCRVETSCGIIESNLEKRIEGLKSAFYELLESEDRG
ncbi:MAG: FliH/SctL family protein [Bacillota bacterium]|nr:FliH/SctL family protein [Bacillota bacterium]